MLSTLIGLELQRVTTNPLEGLVAALDELPGVLELPTTELGRDAD